MCVCTISVVFRLLGIHLHVEYKEPHCSKVHKYWRVGWGGLSNILGDSPHCTARRLLSLGLLVTAATKEERDGCHRW